MQICGQIFMYAIATGRAERNPVPDLRGALKTPVAKHYSFLKASELPEYLKKLKPMTAVCRLSWPSDAATHLRPHPRTAGGAMDRDRLGQGRLADSG